MNVPGLVDQCRGFLYRRLAFLISCQIKILGVHPLSLDSKYQVNSLQDVFCHPFYWQLYGWLDQPPRLVVDLGAHCGHFSMLADTCVQVRFGAVQPEYLLVEPNPHLVPVIRRNLKRSGLCPRHLLRQGLVGRRGGSATLWISPKNYLSASLQQNSSSLGVQADYLDLEQLIGDRLVDLLKIDIEGAEYELVKNYPSLLKRVNKVMVEIHAAAEGHEEELYACFRRAGLSPHGQSLDHSGYKLAMFERA